MPTRRRPCITAACPHLATNGPRCPTCEAAHQRQRNAKRTHYQGDWQRVRAETKAQWIADHGPWCPGWQRPGHTVHPSELTVDHAAAATRTAGLTILCRPCNSSKGTRSTQEGGGAPT